MKSRRDLWAKKHKNWTLKEWQNVLWADEFIFEDRVLYGRRKPGKRLKDECVLPKVKGEGV